MSDPYPKYNPLARAYWTVPPSQGAIRDERQMTDDGPECVYCGHSIEIHGTEQTGCRDCACGMDPDWDDAS